MFWSIFLVVTLKYVVFVMRADNEGEGGIIALLGLAARTAADERRRWPIIAIGLAGAALFYGDGMITPAISVLSAIEGLQVATPVFTPYIVPITVVVLIALFAVQSRGSEAIGQYFGPVMIAWFGVLAGFGLVQVLHHPGVLAGLDPRFGVRFFVEHGWASLPVLGSVFLALTGAEALYADMGHFGRAPIRLDWFVLVLPALVLNYFGQGALVLDSPALADAPFFHLFPGWALYPVVILAAAATVIASQAVLSGAFSLSQQAMQLGLLPRLDVRQTSETAVGQVYVPQVNWMLMVAVVALVLSFRSSDALASAYGIAVSGTMLVTSLLLSLVMRRIWNWGWAPTVVVIGCFLLVDLGFFAANSLKILEGGWFPLLVGSFVFALMSTWRRGRQIVLARLGEENAPMAEFIDRLDTAAYPRVKGTAIYLTAHGDTVPYAMIDNLRHIKTLHDRVVLLTIGTQRRPRVPEDERVSVSPLPKGFWRMTLHFGFSEKPDVPAALEQHRDELAIDIADTSFFLGRETPVPAISPDLSRWREKLYGFMTRNAVSASDFFEIPPARVIELGTQVQL